MGGGLKKMAAITAMAAIIAAVTLDAKWAAAQEHHVVGGDRGWDTATDLVSWSAGKIFRVGDNIWFAYSAAAQDIVLELGNIEEYESCNLQNPIKMYTDGIDRVPLDQEGTRYFTSSKPGSCKDGLKLNVTVLPRDTHPTMPTITIASEADSDFAATAPTTPSASSRATALSSLLLLFISVGLCSWTF